MFSLSRVTSEHPDFRAMVQLLDRELAILDGDDHAFYAKLNTIDKIQHAIVAYQGEQPVGCGAIRAFDDHSTEVKRMFVLPAHRNQGIAGKVLAELETWAQELGFSRCVLETGKRQPDAIWLYQKSGYRLIPNYGQYAGVDNSVCMEKNIGL